MHEENLKMGLAAGSLEREAALASAATRRKSSGKKQPTERMKDEEEDDDSSGILRPSEFKNPPGGETGGTCGSNLSCQSSKAPNHRRLSHLLVEQSRGQFLDLWGQQLGPSDHFAQRRQRLVDELEEQQSCYKKNTKVDDIDISYRGIKFHDI